MRRRIAPFAVVRPPPSASRSIPHYGIGFAVGDQSAEREGEGEGAAIYNSMTIYRGQMQLLWVHTRAALSSWPALAQCGLRLAQQARVIVDFTH